MTHTLTSVPESTSLHVLPPPDATAISVAAGDGIGPEITDAVLRILSAAGAHIAIERVTLGTAARSAAAGIPSEAWESIRRTRVLLKGPMATPQGGGVKSLNVTLRKALGLFGNVRPCTAYAPYVPTRHPTMDLVIIRENEEDVYAGIEHQQTDDVVQCLKLISVPGTERIVRYAFDYARATGRRKVTCMTKDNIMKMTDGLFHDIFRRIGAEYPDLQQEHLIVDIGAARLADCPEAFDVVVLPNLYGDILSDVAAEIAGSIGMAGSANVGERAAMFEAVHGSAPDLAGLNVANPSGLLLAAIQMLVHIGQPAVATRIHNAWLRTLEEGVHTADIFQPGISHHIASTSEFAAAVIERLGLEPRALRSITYDGQSTVTAAMKGVRSATVRAAHRALVGVDVFVRFREPHPAALAGLIRPLAAPGFTLEMITNRGVVVWPTGFPETYCTDHWRCRFVTAPDRQTVTPADIVDLLARLHGHGVEFVKMEQLYTFDGKPGFSRGQGQ